MPYSSDAQRRAVHAKLKAGQLRGKRYARVSKPVIVDYRKKLVVNRKGKKVGRFQPAKIVR